jgi:4-hydroxy-3-methylbut-2-enyl diphosphate reductase IspH
MKRFRPAPRPETLHNKAMKTLEERRHMPPKDRRTTLQIAGVLGMDDDARAALQRLLAVSENRKTAVAGEFMPDDGIRRLLAGRGISESVEEADFFKFRRIVIPFSGIYPRTRKLWEEAGHPLEDLTAPQVRRAQVALGLMRMEGAQGLVIGRHDDAETQALAGGGSGIRIIEDTTDTARLVYSPAFGVVAQTTLSPQKIEWLVQQLRFRYRDARVTFLNTVSPSMNARVEALEKLLVTCDRAVIVGRPGEASCEALAETALRRGKPAVVVAAADDLQMEDLAGKRIALSAGAFALDETIRVVAETIARL